jgi:hypothetical protein
LRALTGVSAKPESGCARPSLISHNHERWDDEHKDWFSWERLAVTREDFENGELLGFPVKRNPKQPNGSWARYLAEYGDQCVEAGAISANELCRVPFYAA